MEGRQLAAIGMLWALALGLLGWRLCRAMAAPLLYLVFLVPFGAFATPLLQSVTARFIELGLRLLGIPHYVDSLIIETPAGTFLVAEACAGLRFLDRGPRLRGALRRDAVPQPGAPAAVFAAALVVPILANGIRALGIVVLGAASRHARRRPRPTTSIYGWGFFSVVILLLILAGLPFREDANPASAPAAPSRRAPAGAAALAAAAALVALLASAAPGLAAVLNREGGTPPLSGTPRLAPVPGCTEAAEGGLDCGTATVTARLLVFPARSTWAGVAATRRRLLGHDDEALTFRIPAGAVTWDARVAAKTTEAVAAAAWLDGQPAGDGLRSRAVQALNSLRGNGGLPVLLAITLQPRGEDAAGQAERRALLTSIAEAQAELAAKADALSHRPGN